ncbi:MAG: diguanylate cyclase [Gammaproteobacteria bacterium]|nr:diguanylate cyclase [Gammaproteobacteria bacterium]
MQKIKAVKLLRTIWVSPQLRAVLLFSLLITLIFPLYNTYVTYPEYNALLTLFVEDDALRVGKHLSQPLVEAKERLLQGALPEEFIATAETVRSDFELDKIKVFDRLGRVLYSSNPKEVGTLNQHDYFHVIVATGSPYSKLVSKSDTTAEGLAVDRDVVESYTPIMNGSTFIGAFELYYDVTGRKRLIDQLHFRSTLQLILLAVLLIAILLVVQMRSAVFVRSRDQALSALSDSEARFRNIASSAQDGIIEIDTLGRVAFWNQAAQRIFGYSVSEAIGHDILQLIAPQQLQQAAQQHLITLRQTGMGAFVGKTTETIGVGKDRREIPLEVSVAAVQSSDGFRAIGIFRDITQRKKIEVELRLGSSVIEHAMHGITITDASGIIQVVNPAFTAVTGYKAEDVIGKSPRVLKSGRHDAAFYRNMWQSLRERGSWDGEIWNRRADGEIYPERLSLNAIYDDRGEVSNYVALFSDITTQKKTEADLQYLAFYDPLTGIANRMLFHERLDRTLKEFKRLPDDRRQIKSKNALLFIDLDQFKQVNDTYGHEIGDLLLKEAANRMVANVREIDTVARLGGDEFAIIIRGIALHDVCEKIAANLIAALLQPFYCNDIECHIGASIGIAIAPDNGESVDELLKCADSAMYAAKKGGGNRYHFATGSPQ